jgi:hypothetical protein
MQQQHYRRIQILAVAAGVFSFLASLIGAALENALLARAGLFGFLIAVAAVIAVGLAAWSRFD